MSYQNLLAALQSAADDDNCGVVECIVDPPGCFSSDDNGHVFFDCTLHCKNWKWKRTTDSRRVSIIIQISETIRRRDRVLLKSTVQVNYLRVEGSDSRLLQSFHYDYDPTQLDHALFHAQISNECIAIDAAHLGGLKIDFTLPSPEPICMRTARIPTSDMTYPSVLVALASDHISLEIFKKFFEKARELQALMPLPEIDKLRESLGAKSTDLRCSHWFAHLPL